MSSLPSLFFIDTCPMLFGRRLDADTLQRMRRDGVIVLSAHLDDACFSIGGLSAEIGGGTLINVFNRSCYLARRPDGLNGALPEDVVASYRNAEDEAFALQSGVQRESLNGCEPGFFGRRPNDLSGLELDMEQVRLPLMNSLQRQVRSDGGRPYLLVPMAVGRHVNHHAVYEVIVGAAPQLKSNFRLCFYEDLPYSHDPFERLRGIRRFQKNLCSSDWSRHFFVLPAQAKLKLVELYGTQLKRKPSLLKFRPASLWPVAMHEALWMAPYE